MYAKIYKPCEKMLAMADAYTFSVWLEGVLRDQEMSQAELARKAGVTRSAINGILTGRRGPGPDLCKALAVALGIPEEIVFREAGLLTHKPETDEQTERLLHLYNQMTDDEREEWVALGEFVFSRRKVKKLRTAEG